MSNPLTEDTLYTHYRIEQKNMPVEWDETICDSLAGVMRTLEFLDIYLDDDTETSDGEPRSVTITGIGMTKAAYKDFLKENNIQ